MEPSNLSQIPPEDADLERLLRSSAGPELDDAGFTDRVLSGLPRARPALAWVRLILPIGGAAAGLAVGLARGARLPDVAALAAGAAALTEKAAGILADPWPAVALSVAVAAASLGLWRAASDSGPS
jgi:hypothetical protein